MVLFDCVEIVILIIINRKSDVFEIYRKQNTIVR